MDEANRERKKEIGEERENVSPLSAAKTDANLPKILSVRVTPLFAQILLCAACLSVFAVVAVAVLAVSVQ